MKATRYTREMIEYYNSRGLWTLETWPDTYERNARLYPDEEAFVSYKRGNRAVMTWAEYIKVIDRLALGFLEIGLKADDRVLCQLPSRLENALSTHPKVAGIQVFPIPDTRLGKNCAFIIPKQGEVFSFDEMINCLNEKNLAK